MQLHQHNVRGEIERRIEMCIFAFYGFIYVIDLPPLLLYRQKSVAVLRGTVVLRDHH